jgi:hypothetical protein
VNAIPALAVLAVVGLTVAGCGVKAVSGPITVAGIATIANVKVGTLIRCKGGPAARTPHWFGSSYLRVPGVPGVNPPKTQAQRIGRGLLQALTLSASRAASRQTS